MEVIYLSPSEIKPYEKNPRKNEKAVLKVADSIKEFGFKNPILVDSNMVIVAGHTRWKASLKLGLKKIPVIVLDISEEKARAYRIADNKISEFSDWDNDLLRDELSDLIEIGIDVNSIGFTDDEINKLLSDSDLSDEVFDENESDDYEVGEIDCKNGDVWDLDGNILVCNGDIDVCVYLIDLWEKFTGKKAEKTDKINAVPAENAKNADVQEDLSKPDVEIVEKVDDETAKNDTFDLF